MFMDIFNLSTETGFTIEAYAFRMQGATPQWIEAKASKDSEWDTVALLHRWAAAITVSGQSAWVQRVSDIDFSPEPSGLFPILTVKED